MAKKQPTITDAELIAIIIQLAILFFAALTLFTQLN